VTSELFKTVVISSEQEIAALFSALCRIIVILVIPKVVGISIGMGARIQIGNGRVDTIPPANVLVIWPGYTRGAGK
jgi:hypothetical protein